LSSDFEKAFEAKVNKKLVHGSKGSLPSRACSWLKSKPTFESLFKKSFQEESGYTEKQTNPSDTAECSKRINI
jgi:hypothetical protein